jgi:Domain of unknown function (DUF4184)
LICIFVTKLRRLTACGWRAAATITRMPLTFPSHAAAVVPLKLWQPRHLDGVALVVGSAAPDFAYAVAPYAEVRAHVWWALIWFCVPVTFAASALIRWVAAEVATCLPGYWRDYALLGSVRRPWYVTAACAWFAAVTHRVWDMFTHASIDQGQVRFAWLSDVAFHGQPWWRLLHYGSTVLGAVGVAFAIHHVGRHHLLRAWHPEATFRETPVHRPRFWIMCVTAWVVGVAPQPFLAGRLETQILFVRLLAVFALGLAAAALIEKALAATAASGLKPAGSAPTGR